MFYYQSIHFKVIVSLLWLIYYSIRKLWTSNYHVCDGISLSLSWKFMVIDIMIGEKVLLKKQNYIYKFVVVYVNQQ